MQRIAIFLFLAFATVSKAQTRYFNTEGAAIRGYDAVVYFTKGEAVKGSDQLTFDWQGAKWHFTNKENLEAFKNDPEKFAPQYGGYCAYGVSEDHKSPTDPKAFTILDGKLYLNYNMKVREMWSKDTKGYIEKAEQNWPKLKLQND